MKIAILSFYSGVIKRGVEKWTHDIATKLSANHEVWVLQNAPNLSQTKYNVYSTNLKISWKVWNFNGTFLRMLYLDYRSLLIGLSTLKSLLFLWKKNFDIIIPTSGGWQPALVRILTWLKRRKMVIVGHAGKGWDDRNNLWCFPDVFVALSSYGQEWARKVNPFIKVVNIPDGVDIEKFKPQGERIDINLSKPIILTVGALTIPKRIDLIIKAVSRLRKGSLLIVGEGEEKENLVKLGQKKLKDRFLVKSFGFEEMPAVYRSCDLFTSASLSYLSFEIVLIEAMASGLAVVANNDLIREEIVGDAGILINPNNIDSYAKALRKALRVKWGEKPRNQARNFSWEIIVEKYEKLFRELLE